MKTTFYAGYYGECWVSFFYNRGHGCIYQFCTIGLIKNPEPVVKWVFKKRRSEIPGYMSAKS